jgi:hypothetical protein
LLPGIRDRFTGSGVFVIPLKFFPSAYSQQRFLHERVIAVLSPERFDHLQDGLRAGLGKSNSPGCFVPHDRRDERLRMMDCRESTMATMRSSLVRNDKYSDFLDMLKTSRVMGNFRGT